MAIDEENEEQISECQKDMRGNDPLRSAVNATLSDIQKSFLIERQQGMTKARQEKSAEKLSSNIAQAKAFAEKNSEV